MKFNEVLNDTLYIILTVILPVVATYIVNLIKSKIEESKIISEATKNEKLEETIKNELNEVMDAVWYVNQTYTDSLKASGKFDKEAQDIAFDKAYAKAVSLISESTRKTIEQVYGSFDEWLELKIEASVGKAKTDKNKKE